MIITFSNFKGGVGKTTTTALFAFILSEFENKKVLCVDTDPQSNLTESLALTFRKELDKEKNLFKSLFSSTDENHIQSLSENLDILSGSWDMVNFEVEARSQFKQSFHSKLIQMLLNEVKGDYDYIFIDTAPTTNIVMDNAIFASDWVLITTQTEPLAYDSTQKYYSYLLDLYKNEDTHFELLGILPYLIGRSVTDQKLLVRYQELFKNFLFENTIRQSDRVKTWSNEGITTTLAHDKNTLAMYKDVVQEALERMKGEHK